MGFILHAMSIEYSVCEVHEIANPQVLIVLICDSLSKKGTMLVAVSIKNINYT